MATSQHGIKWYILNNTAVITQVNVQFELGIFHFDQHLLSYCDRPSVLLLLKCQIHTKIMTCN